MTEAGYSAAIVVAFLTEHGEYGRTLNDERLPEWHREMVERWRSRDVVPLRTLDPFLMRYDLMLFELEQWAIKHHGWDGFIPAGGRRMNHYCPDCGHKVKYEGELDGPVKHLPDGRHQYTPPAARPSYAKRPFVLKGG